MVNQKLRRYRKCPNCNQQNLTLNKFCSEWCLEESQVKRRSIKYSNKKFEFKPIKIIIRKCKCGANLEKHLQKCSECIGKRYMLTESENKCKNCNGPILCRQYSKYKKIFCESECQKAYYYKNKTNGK